MKLYALLTAVLTTSCVSAEPLQLIGFEWDPVTQNTDGTPCTDLDHYTVKVSFVGAGQYDSALRLNVPVPATTGAVMLDRARPHWAVVTASNTSAQESAPSNEVMVAQLEPTPEPTVTPEPTATPVPTATATPRPTATPTRTPVPTLTESQRAAKYIADSDRFQQCISGTYPAIFSRCWR